jgi:hypothetical protein
MEIVKRELARHSIMIDKVWGIVYSNPKHLKGKPAYYDKKKLWEIRDRIHNKRQLMKRRDLQFLENLIIKYSR